MAAALSDHGEAVYHLHWGEQKVPLAPVLGQRITLAFSGRIFCVNCGRATRKSFNQGHCFPCFRSLARNDACIMAPEKCHFHAGTCREPDWATSHCMVGHRVYLAHTSGAKVGLTRENQIPVRWIDQGAVAATALLRLPDRRAAGLAEDLLRAFCSDRTQWQRMLKGDPEPLDLVTLAQELTERLQSLQWPEGLERERVEILLPQVVTIRYPVIEYPKRVSSLNPDKQPLVEGTLLGIKGQYLILDTGCLNLRKFSGYELTVTLP